jgi:hypothetical protein
MARCWFGLVAAFLVLQSLPRAQDTRPLPDQQVFLAEARKYLRSNDLVRNQYFFKQTDTRVSRDSAGRPQETDVRVYEVYPAAESSLTYRRLILRNGGRPADLESKDREQAAKMKKWTDERDREGAGARAARERERAEADRHEAAVVDELPAIYRITMTGREWMAGRPAIAFTLDPRPDYKAKTDEAGIIRKFKGRAWIDEADHQLARLEMEVVEPVSIGLGIIARLFMGSHATIERRKIDGETWLPTRSHFVGSGRLLLLRRLDIDQLSEYSDYSRLTADTATPFMIPK